MKNVPKNILIPLDGSANALRSLDYIEHLYGPKHNLDVGLFYVSPSLPPILTDEKTMDDRLRAKRVVIEKKNTQIAERILEEAKTKLIGKGFDEQRITTISQKKGTSTAWDICNRANRKRVDAVLLTRRGRTDLETMFLGGVSNKLIHYCGGCPVWIAGAGINSKNVLVCMDSSENSLRAVDHTAFMLSGTSSRATLFHSIRHLSRYVPLEVLEEDEALQAFYQNRAGEQIAPYMEKAQKMLLDAGLTEEQIAVKVVDGSKDAADDILTEARNNGYGTIVLGRHGQSTIKEFIFGSVTSKIVPLSHGSAIWIVQ